MLDEIVNQFEKLNLPDEYPDFYKYNIKLDKILWVLLVSKELFGQKYLNANQISQIIINVFEIRITTKSVTNSLKNAKDSVHVYQNEGITVYEIMKPGKERLFIDSDNSTINTFYFQPGESFTSKKVLSTEILSSLSGKLRIVDPYCNERTLDVLSRYKDKKIEFLTKLSHLRRRKLEQIEREIRDFLKEYVDIEIRVYSGNDLHDRYIVSENKLILIGHSIKDLGNKESFAVRLDKKYNLNIYESIIENFNRKWKSSSTI